MENQKQKLQKRWVYENNLKIAHRKYLQKRQTPLRLTLCGQTLAAL